MGEEVVVPLACPDDTYEMLQWQMVHAHNMFKAAYNSILHHLENPPTKDLDNFLDYCHMFIIGLGFHHDSEEVVMFPFLNTKMDFSGEGEAHKAIHDALESLEETIKNSKADKSKFDGAKMKQRMDDLKDVLFDHLNAEVEHIKASNIREAGFQPAELKDMNLRLEKYAKGHADVWRGLPFLMGHIAPELKPHWPPFPWLLRKVFIPWVFAPRYSGLWKYCPYSIS